MKSGGILNTSLQRAFNFQSEGNMLDRTVIGRVHWNVLNISQKILNYYIIIKIPAKHKNHKINPKASFFITFQMILLNWRCIKMLKLSQFNSLESEELVDTDK